MIRFKRYKELFEGGWQTVKTQSTKLNPTLVKKSIIAFEKFGKEFNSWVTKLGHEPLDFVEANGSSGYVDRDLTEDPEKVYGDVDYLVILPGGKYESFAEFKSKEREVEKKYRRLIGDYVEAKKPSNIPLDEYMDFVNGSSGLIFEIDKDVFVQIDFVFGHPTYKEWMRMRYTPEYNLKGFVTGNLFSSIGKILNINLGKFGVLAKTDGEILVPYTRRKDVSLVEITSNPKNFFVDLVKFFASYNGLKLNDINLDSYLEKNPGLDKNKMSLENIAKGFIGFANTMEMNGILGNRIQQKSAKELIDQVRQDFLERGQKVREKSKYDKAQTELALKAKQKAFDNVAKGEKIINKILK